MTVDEIIAEIERKGFIQFGKTLRLRIAGRLMTKTSIGRPPRDMAIELRRDAEFYMRKLHGHPHGKDDLHFCKTDGPEPVIAKIGHDFSNEMFMAVTPKNPGARATGA